MSIELINNIGYYTTVTGVTNSNEAIHTISPALKFTVDSHVLTDQSRMNNEVYKFHLRSENIDATNFKIIVGCDGSNVGPAIELDFTATSKIIRLVNQTALDTNGATIAEKDITTLFDFSNATSQFIECRVEISKNKIRFYYAGRLCIDSTQLVPMGTQFGFLNSPASSIVYVSDPYYYFDQILYGNVNLNGAPNSKGKVILYNQATYQVVSVTHCDSNGDYMIFVDDDPVNGNKYFLYGFIEDYTASQPRGVSNITL